MMIPLVFVAIASMLTWASMYFYTVVDATNATMLLMAGCMESGCCPKGYIFSCQMNDTAASIECVSFTCVFLSCAHGTCLFLSIASVLLILINARIEERNGSILLSILEKLYTEGKAREGELTAHVVASTSYARPKGSHA